MRNHIEDAVEEIARNYRQYQPDHESIHLPYVSNKVLFERVCQTLNDTYGLNAELHQVRTSIESGRRTPTG